MKDITDYLSEEGVAFMRFGEHHHVREGWLGLDCPFCGPGSGRYHLGLNLRTFYLHCWRCGRMSPKDTLDALGLRSKRFYSYRSIVDSFPPASSSGVVSERFSGSEWYSPTSETGKSLGTKATKGASGRLKEPSGRGPFTRSHRDYLRGRGFSPSKLAQLWALEGIGLAAKLAWRIYIPIAWQDVRVSWTTRAVGERVKQRYISAGPEQEVIPHKHLIYGLDLCAHAAVVVEGPTDAWKIGPGAVAVFGTDYTIWQVRHLSSLPKRFICFDSDPEAQKRARELASHLSCFPGTTEVITLDADDPGSASEKELRLLRKVAGL